MLQIDFHQAVDLAFNGKNQISTMKDAPDDFLRVTVPVYQVTQSLIDTHNSIVHHPLVGVEHDLPLFKRPSEVDIPDDNVLFHDFRNGGET